jgi:hypothetical protein
VINLPIQFCTILVAHRNTGNEFATSFQIQLNRIRVALDFMLRRNIQRKTRKITPIRWFGKGINSNARERAIVIHGAEYVSSSFIQNKRLGRSLGCPSLPMNLSSEIIQTIKDKSCLFIYYPSNSYKVASKLIS